MTFEAIKDLLGGHVFERLAAGFVGAILATLIASASGMGELDAMDRYLFVSLPGGIVGVVAWTWWRERSLG